MKKVIAGIIYNTEKMIGLCSYCHHNNGNYSGTTRLYKANNGKYVSVTETNGQDLYLCDQMLIIESNDLNDVIDRCDLSADQEKYLIELGIIKEA